MGRVLLVTAALVMVTAAFTGDDRFLRKYAMMKVYESCLGRDVVREVRQEMRSASNRCMATPPVPSPQRRGAQAEGANRVGVEALPQNMQPVAAPLQGQYPAASSLRPQATTLQSGLDFQKLQQAVLAGFRHAQQSMPGNNVASLTDPGLLQGSAAYSAAAPPYSTVPQYIQPYQQPYHQPYQPYQAYQPPPQPYQPNYQIPQYQQPLYQPYYRSHRASRDLVDGGKLGLGALNSHAISRVRNVTCVMQELGYLDMNLEPDYGRMLERIERLPVAEPLKRDMAEGVNFCRKFADCPTLPKDKADDDLRFECALDDIV